MPRRKKPAEGLESQGQDGEEEEEEKRNPANAKKKRSFVDAFIVISDSDGEVSDGFGIPRACAGPCCCRTVPEQPTLSYWGQALHRGSCAIPFLTYEMNQILFD